MFEIINLTPYRTNRCSIGFKQIENLGELGMCVHACEWVVGPIELWEFDRPPHMLALFFNQANYTVERPLFDTYIRKILQWLFDRYLIKLRLFNTVLNLGFISINIYFHNFLLKLYYFLKKHSIKSTGK